MIPIADLIESVSIQLYDDQNNNWSEPELLAWLEEAVGALASLRPDVFTETVTMPLAAGTRQATPDGFLQVLRVLSTSVTEGGPSRSLTRFDIRSMSAARPTWRNDPPGQARQFALVADLDVFYLYPPQPTPPHFAEIEAVVVPDVPRPDAEGYATAELDIDERFRRVLVDYVLYRTYAKDLAAPGHSQRSGEHYQAFMQGTMSNYAMPDMPRPPQGGG